MASIAYIANMCRSSILNTQSQNGTYNVCGVRVLPKDYWKQNYKATAAVRRISKVEGEGVSSECVVQRWFQRFNTREGNTKDLPCSGGPILWDIENIRRVLEENPQKKYS